MKKTIQKKPKVAKPMKKSVAKPKKAVVVRSTVCLEGYKISKAGKCVKDSKYQTIIASIPMAPPMPSDKKTAKPTFAQQIKAAQLARYKLKPMKLSDSSTVTFGLKGPSIM
jgi:hypothetical protein